ncbi:unnamed protein product [Brassica napus]|uniref:(rape) hypothetical protein n=1 Tax=Brassica napus TaxID=3708 RepID=A0A816WI69_BRANA|nr:unnamed protein product [Brassica napus]
MPQICSKRQRLNLILRRFLSSQGFRFLLFWMIFD